MKSPELDTIAVTIDSNGAPLEHKKFGIANVAKAIHAITTLLYKNPAWSVVAEISANAYDAQIAAGTQDKPFIVTLPSYFRPTFAVRDFGISMSHEFMMDTETGYCGLFYSSKSETNEQNGSFGIGRLTMLALGDTYTAICYKDSKKRIYTVTKENCIPNITFCGEFETDEPDGFEVSADVQSEHIDEFKESAAKIFMYYPVKPTIKGQTIYIPEIDYTVKGADWGITLGGEPVAIMGVYSYPIEPKYFTNLSDFEESLINAGLVLNFGLGELSVNLSRNGLFYDNRTKQAIINKLQIIRANLAQQIQADFDSKCSSVVDAYKLYFQYFSSEGQLYKLGKYLGEKFQITYKNKTITDWKFKVAQEDRDTSIKLYTIRHRRYGTSVNFEETGYVPMYVSELIFVFGDDLQGKKATKRIRNFLKTKYANTRQYYQVFLVKPSAKFLQDNDTKLEDFTPVSSLPLPTSESAEHLYNYNPKARLKIFQLVDDSIIPYKSDHWEDVDEDFDIEENDPANPRVYAHIYRYGLVGNNYSAFRQLQKLGFNLPEFYGIRLSANDVTSSVKTAGWISIEQYIAQKRAEFMSSARHDEMLTNYRKYSAYDISRGKSHSRYKSLLENSYIVRHYKDPVEPEECLNDYNFVQDNRDAFDFSRVPELPAQIGTSLHNQILNEYPLIADMALYGINSEIISSYVAKIDQQNGRDIEDNPENI